MVNDFAVEKFDEEDSLTGVIVEHRRRVSTISAWLYQVTEL